MAERVHRAAPERHDAGGEAPAEGLPVAGQLAGGVAHDFNNMLQAILGYSEMAMAQIPNDQPAHADIEAVQNAAGCVVAPGFIETHTHFDGTMWWEPDLKPLAGFGATTVIMPIAIENITRAPSLPRSRSRCQAPTPPTTSAVVR